MQKLKIGIIIVLVVIIFLVMIYFIYRQNNIKENNNNILKTNDIASNITNESSNTIIDDSEKVEISYNTLFSIEKCINQYLNYIYLENTEAIYNLLDKDYINENKITKENVLTKLDNLGEANISIKEIAEKKDEENSYTYVVSGTVERYNQNNEAEKIENYNINVKADMINMTFSIIPIKNNT